MRKISVVLAVAGGCALAASVAAYLAAGNLAGAGWMLIGPTPFYLAGLLTSFRDAGGRAGEWLLASGALFCLQICCDDLIVPAAAGGLAGWVAAVVREWCGTGCVLAGLAFVGLFPDGTIQRRSERLTLAAVALAAAVTPVLLLVAGPSMHAGLFGNPDEAAITSPLYLPAARPLLPAAVVVNDGFPVLVLLGLILLYRRYQRSGPEARRKIRWMLVYSAGAMALFALLTALSFVPRPGWLPQGLVVVLWVLTVLFVLGPLVITLSEDGMLGIDHPDRRAAVHRVLRLMIAVNCAAAAATVGLLASQVLPAGSAILLAVGAALALQPAQRRLGRLADRWMFGDRLDGYDVLARFGALLEAASDPADLLPELAGAIQRGLHLRWAQVRLDVAALDDAPLTAGAAGIRPDDPAEPVLAVPLVHGGERMGQIECGPRADGPLLAEDHGLLASLAGQAATALRNLHLAAELNAQLRVIRAQASQLAASRARVVQATDAERQRIQRDLHDGVQQDVVVLTAKLALAREKLRRGDPRADEPLAELQRDLAGLLGHLRDFAHAIHPPVLADQGLLEAIEAQAARLPVEVVIEAEPTLRRVRYPQHVEAAAWFVVAEALTNAVKHARARRIMVALAQPDGSLAVEVRDDGCGFDPAAARGLGLAGLADRMSTVQGTLRIDSVPGRGTTLRAEMPLVLAEAAGA